MKRLMLILLCFLFIVLPTAAQDSAEEPPLLQLLGYVPQDIATAEGITVSYADYAATLLDREGTPIIDSEADFAALTGSPQKLFMSNLQRLYSGPESLAQYFQVMVEDAGASTGFSWFDIDRALAFGQPPDFGAIVQGTFDPDAITTAFEAHGYTASDIGGLPALCSADGCDQGYNVDVRNANRANPFGGELGRREPLLVSSEFLLASPVLERVEDMAAASSGEADSLADDPAYHAAAEAISMGDGLLFQAQFVNPSVLSQIPQGMPDADQVLVDAQLETYGALPAYELAVFADRQEGETQVALVALVYSDEASAQAATAELSSRLASFIPPSTQSDTPIIADEGGTIESSVYPSAAGDRFVALIRISHPLVPMDAIETESPPPAAGKIFRILVTALNRQELLPLVVTG